MKTVYRRTLLESQRGSEVEAVEDDAGLWIKDDVVNEPTLIPWDLVGQVCETLARARDSQLVRLYAANKA